YWKFRNNFRRDFIKIGADRGEGIAAVRRQPLDCINNAPGESGRVGTMSWGDGMIMHGHYIGMLALEYRMLRDRGEDYEGVLNELYYAINAVNRLDLRAEPIVTAIPKNGFPITKPESLNGFFIRDDASDVLSDEWADTKLNCRCIEGDSYRSNNAANIHDPDAGLIAEDHTHGLSSPSLDQVTSLFVGFMMCQKLLEEDLYVQPTPDDPVMNIPAEIIQITNRIISNARNNEWFVLDMWGWPVANGGGEWALTAYPITLVGNRITGLDYYSTLKRGRLDYQYAQAYYKLPTEEERLAYYETYEDTADAHEQINSYESLNYFPLNSDSASNFLRHQRVYTIDDEIIDDFIVTFDTETMKDYWEDDLPSRWPDMYIDWQDDNKFNDSDVPWPISAIPFRGLNIKDYNNTIMFNLGVASGLFTAEEVWDWAVITKNYQLVLTDAIINNRLPAGGSRTFFAHFLSSFPEYGGFKFSAQDWHPDPEIAATMPKQKFWSPGWGGEYKWNDALESNSEIGHEGQFSGVDYLYMYNLYHYFYRYEIETKYEETYDCFCGSTSWEDIDALPVSTDITTSFKNLEQVVDEDLTIHPKIKEKLRVLDFCTENVFTGISTASTIDIKQLFDHYHSIGISLTEYQTEQFTINDGGQVNIESRLVICNTKELTVEDGGEINLDKGEILVKPGATLIIEGVLNVAPYTNIIVESEGEIIIRNGGTLNNSGYIRLKEGAKMTYEEDAIFQMKDDLAELHFDGGDLFLETNALFTFEKGTSQSGQLRFSEWGEHIFTEGNNRILLEGNGDDDPILVLDEDAEFWPNSEGGLDWIAILSGEVQLDENARLVSLPEFTANNVHFSGLAANRGLITFDQTNISNTVFDEVPIEAALHYKNAGTFDMTLSEVNHTIDGNMVHIKGMGYNISESEFNGDATYMISAQNITQYSRITNTDFNGTLSTVGIIDNSNATVEIKSCDFNNLYAGVHKLDGKAILKCNSFSDFKLAGAIAHNNCILDLSSNAQGGYNTFSKNDENFGNNIALWNAQGLLLNQGFNYFDDQGVLAIIEGTMQVLPLDGLSPVLLARTNRWNFANDAPIAGDIDVESSLEVDLVINFDTGTPNDGACPVSDDLISGTGLVVPSYQDGEANLNSLNFNDVSLSAALNTCIEASNAYDDSKTDVAALALFEEVLTNYPSYDTSRRNDVLARYGAHLMKQTLQHAFNNGEITIADNQGQFHAGVQSYVNVLNALTSVPYNAYNYEQLFYLEMDKAHLFRMIGKTDMALFILLNTESCGLDLEEQAHLNHYKFEWDEEIRMTNYGYKAEFKDTVWVDTTYYNVPIQQAYGEFGSLIVDANTIDYFTCGQQRAQITDESDNNTHPLLVYPNPNDGIFNVEYLLPKNSTGFVIVHDAAGREIYRFVCQQGRQIKTVDVSTVEKGTYFYSYYVDEVLEKTGKVIVQ
ncbi:MAG: T9SS type A sorting domain-containing protein, partial [Crocinitomix sp.]|nr:T9SS type A sorting domain-containing protein [Crocinitomix sp.]